MLVLIDIGFLTLHGMLVLFNLVGWIWSRTRRLHLITMGLTMLSWFALGLWRGFGYCPLTDWHWQVKRQLGQGPLPYSWFKYYLDGLTGYDWNPAFVDGAVVALGLAAFGLSIAGNLRDWRRARTMRYGHP